MGGIDGFIGDGRIRKDAEHVVDIFYSVNLLNSPLWVTAEKQHVRTAPYLWPGAEAPIGGIRPWFWMKFDNTLSYATRVQRVLGFLTIPDSAPRLVTAYFSGLDDAGHAYGPDSPQVDSAHDDVLFIPLILFRRLCPFAFVRRAFLSHLDKGEELAE